MLSLSDHVRVLRELDVRPGGASYEEHCHDRGKNKTQLGPLILKHLAFSICWLSFSEGLGKPRIQFRFLSTSHRVDFLFILLRFFLDVIHGQGGSRLEFI